MIRMICNSLPRTTYSHWMTGTREIYRVGQPEVSRAMKNSLQKNRRVDSLIFKFLDAPVMLIFSRYLHQDWRDSRSQTLVSENLFFFFFFFFFFFSFSMLNIYMAALTASSSSHRL
jgi:hypothetical protein